MNSFSTLSKQKLIHMIGIKGTGMCALAEFLHHEGFTISGSDTSETFYTDRILQKIGIIPKLFSEDNITESIQLIIYSAAYGDNNPEIKKAKQLNIPMKSYPEMLGLLSKNRISAAICGVHGKTTTTGMTGTIAKALDLPAAVIAGSAITAFDNSSILYNGEKYLIAETCEYRRHFLNYAPAVILLTSVESDHQDYYPDYASIRDAFIEFCNTLPDNGTLIYCKDDPGASEVADKVHTIRSDIRMISYGLSRDADISAYNLYTDQQKQFFSILAIDGQQFSLSIPGIHSVVNALGALVLTSTLYEMEHMQKPSQKNYEKAAHALACFSGAKRRSEYIGTWNGISIYDDYGHHPTAIYKTIKGFKNFFPENRIIVDFMSHTYSRTKALFNEFAHAFSDADVVIMHKIYASAREQADPEVSGELLAQAIRTTGKTVYYFEEPLDAVPFLHSFLKPNDIIITMGAGNNWQIGPALLEQWSKSNE
ncbi:MAG TPA: UDP-N-acetylmuramate--L-alanine ligase [Spirochaetia bacterium]|nr:UDP-N-acetylmuramate--L-alanine ligase [Spirochaetales bacterium]HPD79929.1 UDP-N-acetylmuramate--L-alanine ligase [Spirochaetales bacterium]HRS65672.1 UDP-N-acetylmuramate--L-alanine ligase [Spirochaetia bacterium]